jgi:hypothetical protein
MKRRFTVFSMPALTMERGTPVAQPESVGKNTDTKISARNVLQCVNSPMASPAASDREKLDVYRLESRVLDPEQYGVNCDGSVHVNTGAKIG